MKHSLNLVKSSKKQLLFQLKGRNLAGLRYFWLAFGLLCVGLAFLGVVTPILPTVPFLLLAAYAFARSSPRLAAWLEEHATFGPMIQDWRDRGAIDRKTKRVSVAVMGATFLLSLVLGVETYVLLIQAVVLGGAATFVLTRPD